jgi:5-methylcytosine-specific restriction endonuclease McrA
MTWLRSDDKIMVPDIARRARNRYAYDALTGALHTLRMYCSMHQTNGWIAKRTALELISNGARKALATPVNGATLLHTDGQWCACMGPLVESIEDTPDDWADYRAGRLFYVHGYLADNPTSDELTLKRAKERELRSREIRDEVWARDGGLCRYCGKHLAVKADKRSADAPTLDHVDPYRAIGASNIVLACRSCNARKMNRTPAEAAMELLPVPATYDGPENQPQVPTTALRGTGRDGTTAPRPPGVRQRDDNPLSRNRPAPANHAGRDPPSTLDGVPDGRAGV